MTRVVVLRFFRSEEAQTEKNLGETHTFDISRCCGDTADRRRDANPRCCETPCLNFHAELRYLRGFGGRTGRGTPAGRQLQQSLYSIQRIPAHMC